MGGQCVCGDTGGKCTTASGQAKCAKNVATQKDTTTAATATDTDAKCYVSKYCNLLYNIIVVLIISLQLIRCKLVSIYVCSAQQMVVSQQLRQMDLQASAILQLVNVSVVLQQLVLQAAPSRNASQKLEPQLRLKVTLCRAR